MREKSLRDKKDKLDGSCIEVIRDFSLNKWLGERPSFLELPHEEIKYDYATRLGLVSRRFEVSWSPVFPAFREVSNRPRLVGKDFLTRFKLQSKITRSRARLYLIYDERDDGFGMFVNAGRGEVTVFDGLYACGAHKRGNMGVCTNLEGHKGKELDGVDATGKYVLIPEVLSCDRLLCPVCFLAHAVRVAKSVSARLETAVERGLIGEVEAGTVSPDPSLVAEFIEKYPKTWDSELWKYCWSWLRRFGFTGLVMVRHARRIDRVRKDLYFSWHLHWLGAVKHFDVCRECATYDVKRGSSPLCHECYKGLMGKVVRANDKGNGLVVKVFGKRKTVAGTICYCMSHASQLVTSKRDSVIRYFGLLSRRKLKSKPIDKRVLCVLCGSVVRHDLKYVGSREIARNVWDFGYKSHLVVEPVDSVSGKENFVEAG